jgi:hypothetical protein
MKTKFNLLTLFLFFGIANAQLEKAATSDIVWNGVTTSSDGRIFVNLPRIEGDKGMRIGEVLKNGKSHSLIQMKTGTIGNQERM